MHQLLKCNKFVFFFLSVPRSRMSKYNRCWTIRRRFGGTIVCSLGIIFLWPVARINPVQPACNSKWTEGTCDGNLVIPGRISTGCIIYRPAWFECINSLPNALASNSQVCSSKSAQWAEDAEHFVRRCAFNVFIDLAWPTGWLDDGREIRPIHQML